MNRCHYSLTPQFGRTPLLLAASSARAEIISLLLDRGADVHVVSQVAEKLLHVE
jgi:ankyrin repeat protein